MAQQERLKILSEITNKIILYYFTNKKILIFYCLLPGLLKCNGGDAKGDYCSLRAVTVHLVDSIVNNLGVPILEVLLSFLLYHFLMFAPEKTKYKIL